MIDVGICY